MSRAAMKQCNRCKDLLPATREFWWANRKSPDGLHNRCKGCCYELPCMAQRLSARTQIGRAA